MTRSIFQCIRQEIVDNLIQIIAINIHLVTLVKRQEHEIDVLTFGNIIEVQENVLQKGYDICLFQGKLQLVVLHFSELQELIDESHHSLHTFCHRRERLLHLSRHLIHSLESVHITLDDSERRTELMRDVGKEPKLILRELILHLHFIAQIIDTAEVDIHIIDSKHHEYYIYKVCPPGCIERWTHLYLENNLFWRPHAIGIARTHMQGVMPYWQIAILRKVDARKIAPILVIPLEIIGE